MSIRINVDARNPGQFFACCGLLEITDRLWPGAEGWFDGREFCVECVGNLRDVLAAAQSVQLADDAHEHADSADEAEDGGDEEESGFQPLTIASPIQLQLDWWQDKALKPWAGSMNARLITLAMSSAINPDEPDPLNQAQVVYDPQQSPPTTATPGRTKKAKKREPYYFDARRGANAQGIDVGFVPDSLKKLTTLAYPAVEFFCLIGLQRCRPTPTARRRVFDYFTWYRPCATSILPAAVNGLLGDPAARRYRFENAFRTGQKKHKAFNPAISISTGDHT